MPEPIAAPVPPRFITFTGLDERTDVARAAELAKRYPIEWGVLLSERNSGNARRYPPLNLVSYFHDAGLQLSAHLCGTWSRRAVSDGLPPPLLVPFLTSRVERVQFNLRDGETAIFDPPRPFDLAALAAQLGARRAIVQCRGFLFPVEDAVDWLFDRSGGAGMVPDALPRVSADRRAPASLVGYAGGIAPDTVARVLAAIKAQHPPEVPYWIDMESGVRTDEWLDLDKCEAVCRAVYPEPA